MNTSYGQCSLFLFPEQHNLPIKEHSSFISALQKIRLISEKINKEKADYEFYTGDNFLNYIAYMGCAPTIQFAASEDNATFCFIKIHHHITPRLIYNQTQTRSPQCPHCNKSVKNWQQNKTSTSIHCDLCCNTSNIEAFNWRKMAGYSTLFIEITDIFPKEAIPQEFLLNQLTRISKTRWQYFYACR